MARRFCEPFWFVQASCLILVRYHSFAGCSHSPPTFASINACEPGRMFDRCFNWKTTAHFIFPTDANRNVTRAPSLASLSLTRPSTSPIAASSSSNSGNGATKAMLFPHAREKRILTRYFRVEVFEGVRHIFGRRQNGRGNGLSAPNGRATTRVRPYNWRGYPKS